jgi:hypothetical protein
MHRIGNIVGEIHYLGFNTFPSLWSTNSHPGEDLEIVFVNPELQRLIGSALSDTGSAIPRVFASGIKAGSS